MAKLTDGNPLQWIVGRDTGTSSETIWATMMGVAPSSPSYPLDPSDFGRCYRLLQLMPSWRNRLNEVAERYPNTPWPEMVAQWDTMAALYKAEEPTGQCPRLYALMRKIRRMP